MKKKVLIVFEFVLLTIFIFGCREEIVTPDTLVQSVNQPVQINETNSYSYFLSGKSFTSKLVIPAYISGNSSRINITLVNYNSGYANIIIKDSQGSERYRHFMAEDISMFTDVTEGYMPKTIEIRTFEFTGDLKIKLSKNAF